MTFILSDLSTLCLLPDVVDVVEPLHVFTLEGVGGACCLEVCKQGEQTQRGDCCLEFWTRELMRMDAEQAIGRFRHGAALPRERGDGGACSNGNSLWERERRIERITSFRWGIVIRGHESRCDDS